jgi:hypothetical protein
MEKTMNACARLPLCPFFHDRLAHMPAMADFLKSSYCLDDYASCARFQVIQHLGPGRVPTDLFPYMIEKVNEILLDQSAGCQG